MRATGVSRCLQQLDIPTANAGPSCPEDVNKAQAKRESRTPIIIINKMGLQAPISTRHAWASTLNVWDGIELIVREK